jgi:mono/diheme cytochrome c family protein
MIVFALVASLAFASTAIADPLTDYTLHCRGCHGGDGSGAPGAVPSFRNQIGKFLLIEGGREYLIRVPGSAQSALSDARTAALLNWLVEEFGPKEVAADFQPFTEQEITKHRRPPLTEVQQVRQRLVEAIASREAANSTPGSE